MSDKINITKLIENDRNSWLSWALTSLMAQKKHEDFNFTKENGSTVADVHVTINGVKVSFKHLIERIEHTVKQDIENRALEIFNERYKTPLEDIEEQLSNIRETLKQKAIDLYKENNNGQSPLW